MFTRMTIMFDRDERAVFKQANLSFYIGFPALPEDPKHGARIILRLPNRDPQLGTLRNLKTAWGAYETLRAKIEDEQEYWATANDRIREEVANEISSPQPRTIIADPVEASSMLAEIRKRQAGEVEAAIALLRKALCMLPNEDPAEISEKFETGI